MTRAIGWGRNGDGRKVALIIVVVSAVFGMYRLALHLSENTVPAAVGVLQDMRTLPAIVVRDEVVVHAEGAGLFVPRVAEETRVRVGEVLGIVTEKEDGQEYLLVAARPGVVRFHGDGLETEMAGEGVWRRSPRQWRARISSGGQAGFQAVPESMVGAGQPLVRVVDSHRVGLYVDVPAEAGWQAGQYTAVALTGVTDETLRARIAAIRPSPEGRGEVAVLQLDRYIPVLDAIRHVDVDVVLARYEGVLVPVDALVWDRDGVGVLVRRSGSWALVPVDVRGQVGNTAAVTGLSPDDRIAVNPGRVLR